MRLELNTETRDEMIQVLAGLLKALNEERELPSGQLKLDDKLVGMFEPDEYLKTT